MRVERATASSDRTSHNRVVVVAVVAAPFIEPVDGSVGRPAGRTTAHARHAGASPLGPPAGRRRSLGTVPE